MLNKLSIKKNKLILRVVLLGVALYLLIGLFYSAGVLFCYNIRNWDVYGGFSLPPLFIFWFFDVLLWPVYLRANLINGFGILHCSLP
jgi:hypothetical protein